MSGARHGHELGSMMRSEVYQAIGCADRPTRCPAGGSDGAAAGARLRHRPKSLSEVAYQILEHHLYLDDDDHQDRPGSER